MAALSAVLADVRQRESGNRYNLSPQQNMDYPRSHASGAYQFQPGTWRTFARASGIGTQYSEAYKAPPAIQDAVAAYAIGTPEGKRLGGISHWDKYSGKYAPVTDVDVTPEELASGAPLTSGDSGDGISFDAPAPQTTGGSADSETGDYGGGGSLPNVVQGDSPTTSDGVPTGGTGTGSGTGGLPSIATWGWDKLVRAFLILLGIVVVAIAAWGVVEGEFNPTKALRRVVK